jgi:hypothetical protein
MDLAQAKKAQRALLTFGLIGGIMALIGVFLPWAFDATGTASGWDCASVWNFTSSPYLPFIGGILAIIGVLGALGRVKIIGFLLPLGGLLAVVGAFWGLSDIGALTWAGISSTYGIIITQAGGWLSSAQSV